MGHEKKKKMDIRDVAPGGRAVIAVIGLVQVAFAVLAFRDLAHRESDEVRGPKPAWVPVILVNWIGPAAYFMFGVRRSTR